LLCWILTIGFGTALILFAQFGPVAVFGYIVTLTFAFYKLNKAKDHERSEWLDDRLPLSRSEAAFETYMKIIKPDQTSSRDNEN